MLINGIYAGLFLSILVGPIIFMLLQTAIERGTRAGLWVGSGIWVSDLLFILFSYKGMAYISGIVQWPNFTLIVGIAGGIILIGLGIGALLSKPISQEAKNKSLSGSPLVLWSKGFAINTFNPFTFFFWISTSGALLQKPELGYEGASLFYTGILGTIIFTDSLKVYLAKLIKQKLKGDVVVKIRKITGLALIIFGILLIIRVLIDSAY